MLGFFEIYFFETIFLHDEIIFFVRIFFCDQVCISTFDSAAQNRYMATPNAYMLIYSKNSPPGLVLKVVYSNTASGGGATMKRISLLVNTASHSQGG